VATGVIVLAALALLLAWIPGTLAREEAAADVLTWAIVGLAAFDAGVAVAYPRLAGAAAPRVAVPTMAFAVAPAVAAYLGAFLDQPRWLYALGFAFSAVLVVFSLDRIRREPTR
jgi:hypothetical protein